MDVSQTTDLDLEPYDNQRLAILCGQQNENLREIEKHLGVEIRSRGNHFQIKGNKSATLQANKILTQLYALTNKAEFITPEEIHLQLKDAQTSSPPYKATTKDRHEKANVVYHSLVGMISGRTKNQKEYLANIKKYDINFSVGPAGTGKTYLAVASAVAALEEGLVNRILLVRPAVEAGEKLGFLPGGLEEKIEPYLRPLYDALYEMLGFEKVGDYIARNIIEIAPLAYMRGRTLNDSFIILDESQNTTTEQMKMFLTRIGFDSKSIITGDITQIDLPKNKKSGLIEAIEVLKNIENIGFTYFDSKDVVRHALVQRIIEAYDAHDKGMKKS